MEEVRYAGFRVRFVASFLDTLIMAVPIAAVVYFLSDGQWFDFAAYKQNLAYAMRGDAAHAFSNPPQTALKWELLFELLVLASAALFWRRWRGATPGKRLLNIAVVDAKSFEEVGNRQAAVRSLGYIVSTIVLLAGFLMVVFRTDKRALHDMMAGTAVIFVDE